MKPMRRAVFSLLVGIVSLGAQVRPLETAPPLAVPIKGIAYQSYKEGSYWDNTQDGVLDFLAGTAANWISFNTPFIFDSETHAIVWRRGVTDYDGLPMAILRAKQRGLKTALYVFVQTSTYGSLVGENDRPGDTDEFFRQFRSHVLRYADLAQREHVELLILGNEMNAIAGPGYREQWVEIIHEVRQRYDGRVSYSAIPNYFHPNPSIDDVNRVVSFWKELDLIGFSVYPQLTTEEVPTREQVVEGWTSSLYSKSNLLRNLKKWHALTGKPILFVEIGYQSVNGAAISPGRSVGGRGTPNEALQEMLYDVLFEQVSLEGGPWLEGMFLWALDTWNPRNDPGYFSGGYGAVNFSFFGKPAGAVVERWYANPTASGVPLKASPRQYRAR
jgi:hypothetical protein